MPQPGMCWWHLIICTYNSWLPGDARGFRSRKHKIHSSGDYKNPPPQEEHACLRRYHEQRAEEMVRIPEECKSNVGQAIVKKLKKENYRVLAVSVAGTHSHALVELPEDEKLVRRIVGQYKTISSHAIREQVPGRIWAGSGKPIRIRDADHHRNVYNYILNQEGAWTWSFRQEQANPEVNNQKENDQAQR